MNKKHLERIYTLIASFDDETRETLESISIIKVHKKGTKLVREGEVCKRSYLIISGIAKKYYLKDGKEVTTEFYFENDLAVVFSSYVFQAPSKEIITCMTDVTVSQTDFHLFQQAKQQFPKLMELDLLMTELYAAWLEDRLYNLHQLNATQRYQQLLQESPWLLQYIRLTDIASYLNISLETLSRIRKRSAI